MGKKRRRLAEQPAVAPLPGTAGLVMGGGIDPAMAQKQIEQMAGPMPPPPARGRLDPAEYGASGVAVIGGIVQTEEYNPDLGWKEWVRVAERMRRSDSVVQQVLFVTELPLRAAAWKIAPASPDPDHLEQASFVETCLFHRLENAWDDLLRQILLMRVFGFMVFEKVFDRDERGRVYWRKLAPRLPKTIYRWWQNADRSLYGVQQWTWDPALQGYAFINIPAAKLLRFTYRQEGDNWEGVSILRAAYHPWWQKQAYLRLQAVGFEREHVGVPVIGLPEGYSDTDVQRAAQIGQNLRSNEQGYVSLPPGWSLEWLKTRGPQARGASILDAIRYLDLQIQNAVLAGFLALGHAGTGSYAMSNDQSVLFLKSLQADAQYICDVFHHDAFPQLLRLNYPDVQMFPRLVAQSVQAYAIRDIAEAVSRLAMAGSLRPTVELEEWLYDVLGVPRPPASLVSSTLEGKPGSRGRLEPDLTGLTPLPLTPEEQIAIANRFTRDVERVAVQHDLGKSPGTVGTAQDVGNTPRALPESVQKALDKPVVPPMRLEELPDAYRQRLMEPRVPMDPVQQAVFARMAREAGRPRLTVALPPDAAWASARLETLARDRAAVADDVAEEARRALETLRAELRQELEGLARTAVDEAVEEREL